MSTTRLPRCERCARRCRIAATRRAALCQRRDGGRDRGHHHRPIGHVPRAQLLWLTDARPRRSRRHGDEIGARRAGRRSSRTAPHRGGHTRNRRRRSQGLAEWRDRMAPVVRRRPEGRRVTPRRSRHGGVFWAGFSNAEPLTSEQRGTFEAIATEGADTLRLPISADAATDQLRRLERTGELPNVGASS